MYYFGVTFEADLEEYTKSNGKKPDNPQTTKMKRERRIAQWLQDGTQKTAQKFREPVF